MTTEDLVESFIQMGYRCYKIAYKEHELYEKLSRHIPIEIEGISFTYFREFVCYKMAKYIKSVIPDAKIEVNLDGNNSNIELELTDEEQRILNSKMFVFEDKHNFLGYK